MPADLDIRYVAGLARIELSAGEAEVFRQQLADVLSYAAKLKQADVSGISPAAHALPLWNVFRNDEPQSGLTSEEALANAPHQAKNLFLVPKVVR